MSRSSEISFERGDSFQDRQRAATHRPPPRGQQHPCARGDRCTAPVICADSGEPVTTPALTYAPFCQKDRGKVYRALAGPGSLPELWVRLHQELGVKGQGGERVTMSRSAPIPLRADIDALLREIRDVLASWDERVRTDQHLSDPDTLAAQSRPDHGRQVAGYCRTLCLQLDNLLGLGADAMGRSFPLHNLEKIPEGARGRTNLIGGYAEVTIELDGAAAGEEILRLKHRVRSVLGETRMVERLDVPCPDPACDLLMLERRQGSNYEAECGACGRLLTTADYHAWVRLYAATVSTAEVDARKDQRTAGAA